MSVSVSKPTPREIYDKIIKDGRWEFVQEVEEDRKFIYISSRMNDFRLYLGACPFNRTLEEIIEEHAEKALEIIRIPFEELRG